MIFETHMHLDDTAFDLDRETLIASLPEKGIGRAVNVGASLAGTKASIALAEQYDFIYAAAGVHPSEVGELNETTFAWLKEQLTHEKVVAVGEIGLDYHEEPDGAARENQKYWFVRQLQLAQEAGLPVMIHSRDAAEDTLRILKDAEKDRDNVKAVQRNDRRGIIHCYSYSPELAREFVKMGYYIGVGGVVTFKNAKKLKATVEQIPLERILLETDCPYMAPEPHRGTRNDPTMLPYIAAQIAELKQVSAEEVERVTWENACRLLFG